MLKNSIIGKLGEDVAKDYVLSKGLNVITRNYHSRYGEIDIIAQFANFIVFIEVKTRKKNSMVKPVEAVDKRKRDKIIKTSFMYMLENKTNLQPRFDIIEVTTKGSEYNLFNINHIENAFCQEGVYAAF